MAEKLNNKKSKHIAEGYQCGYGDALNDLMLETSDYFLEIYDKKYISENILDRIILFLKTKTRGQ